jgi:hypothetical protein
VANHPIDRAEDAAYTFGYHLIVHSRDEALATLPSNASSKTKAAVVEAVDTALHNVMDMLEGFWRLEAGIKHTVELVLGVRVCDKSLRVNSTSLSVTGSGRRMANFANRPERHFGCPPERRLN